MNEINPRVIQPPKNFDVLPLNLPGVISLIESSKDNLAIVSNIVDMTEEFYRTFAAILYSRYQNYEFSRQRQLKVTDFIKENMEMPSFGNWVDFVELCCDSLLKEGDRVAIQFDSIMKSQVPDRKIARQILSEISNLSPGQKTIGKKIKTKTFFGGIVQLRNILRHRTFAAVSLQPLVDVKLKGYILPIVMNIFNQFHVRLVVPHSVEDKGVMSYIVEGVYRRYKPLPTKLSKGISPGACYFWLLDDEDPFLFRSDLVEYDWDQNRSYTYINSKGVEVHCIPLQGNTHSKKGKFNSLDAVFGISETPSHILEDVFLDLSTLLDDIRHYMSPDISANIEKANGDQYSKLVFANAVWKEYSQRLNAEWNWEEWYSGLIIGFGKMGGML